MSLHFLGFIEYTEGGSLEVFFVEVKPCNSSWVLECIFGVGEIQTVTYSMMYTFCP